MARDNKKKRGEKHRASAGVEKVHSTFIDLASDSSEDELSPLAPISPPIEPKRKVGRPPSKKRVKQPAKKQRKTKPKVSEIEALAPEVLDLKELATQILEDNSFDDAEMVRKLQIQCEITSAVLRSQDNPKDSPAKKFPTTIPHYREYFLMNLPSDRLAFLHVADAFQGIKPAFKRKKVVGLVQNHGEGIPLMYAISGSSDSLEEDPLVLENPKWTELVHEFATYNCQKLAQYWDTCRGQKEGTNYASHAEKKLMLFYALSKVKEILNLGGGPEQLRAELGDLKAELKASGREVHADVIITRHPCKDCKRFKEILEKRSGITFTIKECKTVGEVVRVRDKNGFLQTPLFAYKEGETSDEEVGIIQKARLVVEIRGKKSPQTSETVGSDGEDVDLMVETFSRTSHSQASSKKITRSFLGKEKPKSKTMEDDWDLEWTPRNTAQRQKQHAEYPTPPEALFSSRTYEIAERMKKRKRDRDRDESPSASKARRHTRFS